MHILLLTAYFPPDTGAASHLFYELGQAFEEQGHQVSVVTGFPSYHAHGDLARYQGMRSLQETMTGMDVYRIKVFRIAYDTPIGRGLWQFSCAASFAIAGMRIADVDVILVYSPPLPLGLSAMLLRKLGRGPIVLNVQDLFPQSAIDLGVLRQKTLIRFFQTLERFIYRKVDAITVHSSGNQAYVGAHGGETAATYVVHNSVDTNHIQPGSKENDLHRELGLADRFIVTFAGVMGYSQDIDVILDAANLLRDEEKIQFLLVGDGVEKERLQRKCDELGLGNVTWLPMQPRERYPAVLHASDVGLATLQADIKTPTVPSKITSIMAAGRPVVVTMDLQGDAPKLIERADAGLCLPPGQPQILADALFDLANDEARCQQLGRNGRTYVETHLSHEAIVESYEQLFANAINRYSLTQS